MPTTVRSFGKINLGLCIGARRKDGYHELRTIYQTVGLHDRVRVQVERGRGIRIRCEVAGVPQDDSNTCYQAAERLLAALGIKRRVTIEIEKRLPVQGGLGGASSNAVATMQALQHELKRELPLPERMRIAAEIGSDLPLFLIGGTVLGVSRGEEVYPLDDGPSFQCVIATPRIGISTPKAFADWDRTQRQRKLTARDASDRINWFSSAALLWLNGYLPRRLGLTGRSSSGVPVDFGGGRAENPLLELVRTGIANDFERVVFPQHPELRELKRTLQREGANYASLSGSGSAVYGLFGSRPAAVRAARKLAAEGTLAEATRTVTRREYWKHL